jgi:glycosyltransferase involved in cell wall biosynthesis
MRRKTEENLQQRQLRAGGKFFYEGADKFRIRGVTYGTFEPRNGSDYPSPERVAQDFAMMREAGINTVRIYTAPPGYLLDEAARHGLRVIVGLAWMQHVCFLDDRKLAGRIRRQLIADVKSCADHPAVLAFAIGNEIPQQIVRWHGARAIERFLKRLYSDVKKHAPGKLVTYVNYPPTDYLDLSFLDFVCFNVFLHEERSFNAYLAKLQNTAGNRPLVLTEIGLDSLRHGADEQARFLDWQVRDAFRGGAAGVCVFSWTDDWHRGGNRITDWAFGLVDAERNLNPAYSAVKKRFSQIPFDDEARRSWPKVSVVVCAYNAEETIEDNLDSLARLDYPNYEVIVVNDGSRDATPLIAARYPFRLVSVPNGGLSAARNLGWQAATGEIVAYTDADTRVDADWLSYLVQPFLTTDAAGVGGPNIAPEDDDWIAQCVARSPGGPAHVLLDNTVAEHIPGCNMAFRRQALEEVGGFNPVYTKAGDDVDVCWRLQERGRHLAFSPAAMVWHHHRNSVKAYWRQQAGYGEGESFLEHRHQEKFNERGQTRWQGRIYSHLPAYRTLLRSVIYQGRWGGAAFPSVYQGGINGWTCLPQMIEWQLGAAISLIGSIFSPWMLLVSATMFAATGWRYAAHAFETKLDDAPTANSPWERAKHRALIAWLHHVQIWARFYGRITGYFSPGNVTPEGRQMLESAPPLGPAETIRLLSGQIEVNYWDSRYTPIDNFLSKLKLAAEGALPPVRCDDGWRRDYDLHVRAGRVYSFKLKMTAEDHGGLKRLFRAQIKLHRPWRFIAGAAAAAVLAGQIALAAGRPPGFFVAASTAAALLLVIRRLSKFGGQVVAALETAARELNLHSLRGKQPVAREEQEPALEDVV